MHKILLPMTFHIADIVLYMLSSSIEAHFSQMKATGSDTARSYQSNIGVHIVVSTMRNLEKSGMYTVDNTEVGIEINTLQ